MSIIRAPRPESNFYILDKRISEDERLSWSARGMLIFLLGKPDHWNVSVEALVKCTEKAGDRSAGKTAVYAIIKELLALGYMTRQKHADGTLDYWVHETPQIVVSEGGSPNSGNPNQGKPDSGNPNLENPNLGNQTLVSTDSKQGMKNPARIDDAARTKAAEAPTKESAKRAARLPADFAVTEAHRTWAAAHGLPSPDAHFDAFRDYHLAKGSTFKDWDAALRTWMRNTVRFRSPMTAISQVSKIKKRSLAEMNYAAGIGADGSLL